MTFEEIEALSHYHGLTPLPEDFDAFWEERMAEADAVPLEWEVVQAHEVPSFDTCEYLDLWFVGMGGARIYAKYVRPTLPGPLPLVLQFHGYPGASRSFFEQSSFAGMGCALIAMDNPGQGGLSEDVGGFKGTTVAGHLVAGVDGEPKDLYYVRLYQDVRILCRIVRAMGEQGLFDLSRIYVNGASQGGGMGIACCALNNDLIAKACILYPFLSDYRKVYELGADEIAYEGIRYYARWFDPGGTREDEWFGKLAYVETNHFAHLVKCPVLFGTGLADTVCPPETQCAVYNDLSCEKQRLLYPGFGHEEIQEFDDQILAFLGEGDVAEGEPSYLGNTYARYEELQEEASDGSVLTMRYVAPATPGRHPLILMFHDLGRPGRGWHHLTRYVAAGFSVLQLENRADASVETFGRSVLDASVAYEVATRLPDVDPERIVPFGEGYGAALAIETAARMPAWRLVALNPFPAEGLIGQGKFVTCPTLFGTSLMDTVADPAAQMALVPQFTDLVHKRYPKYIHERINAFENEFLSFLKA